MDLCASECRRAFEVCELLEFLADELPKQSAPVWREAHIHCKKVLVPHFQFLSSFMISALLRHTIGDVDKQEFLTRLQSDCADQLHRLSDLSDLFSDALGGRLNLQSPEALGFALRGHFEALRYNLNWEADVLLPLASRTFKDDDRPLKFDALHTGGSLH